MNGAESFNKMMQELRAEYLASFPQKFYDIEAHLQALDFARLRDDFHKLKGTGKTYGIPEISELCAVTEKICLSAASGNSAIDAHVLSNTADSVGVALSVLRKIVASRLAGQELNLANVPDFARLRALGG